MGDRARTGGRGTGDRERPRISLCLGGLGDDRRRDSSCGSDSPRGYKEWL